MRRAICGLLLVAAAVLLVPVSSHAGGRGGHGHGGYGRGWHGHGSYGHGWYGHSWYGHRWHSPGVYVGFGAPLWWGPRPVWYGPPPVYYPPAPVYVSPPRVIVAEEPVYVERAPAAPLPSSYWYYCPSLGGYYPNVPTCPESWVQVPPRAD
jgi:hypothetical protein